MRRESITVSQDDDESEARGATSHEGLLRKTPALFRGRGKPARTERLAGETVNNPVLGFKPKDVWLWEERKPRKGFQTPGGSGPRSPKAPAEYGRASAVYGGERTRRKEKKRTGEGVSQVWRWELKLRWG